MSGDEFVMVTRHELEQLRAKAAAPEAAADPEPTDGDLLEQSFQRFRAGQARKDRERRSA